MINNILISKETRKRLHRDTVYLGVSGENLQEIFIFNLDEDIVGQGIIEIEFEDSTKGFIEIERTERGYELPVKSSLLTQSGKVKMQLRIVQSGQEVFKSEIMEFIVKKAINATETIPEQYPSWIDNLEALKSSLEKAEEERVSNEKERISNEDSRIANETKRQTYYTDMKQKVANGEFNGATYMPNVDKDGNITWTNDKGLENPSTQNIRGPQGIQGPQGEQGADYVLTEEDKQEIATIVEKTFEELQSAINLDVEQLKEKNTDQDTSIQKNIEDIEKINKKDTEQDTSIEELQNKVIELETENKILKNQIPEGQAEGENITLNDSAEMEFKELKVSGNSWQETRSGKNLYLADRKTFTEQGVTITNNGDGTYTVNGTTIVSNDYWLKAFESICFDSLIPICELEEGENVSITLEVISGNVEFVTAVNNFSLAGKLSGTNKQNITYQSINNIMTAKKVSWQFTAKENTVLTNAQFYIGKGNIFTDFKFRIQVELGTVATDYEPYGAMPSPEFPSEIKNVTGSANITICNENFCPDIEKWTLKNGAYIDNDYIVLPEETSYAEMLFPIKYMEKYIIKGIFNVTDISSSPNIFIDLYYLDVNLSKIGNNGMAKIISFANIDNEISNILPYSGTLLEEIKYIKLHIRRHSTYAPKEYKFKNIMISENDIAYKPHQSQTFNFPLSEGQRLCRRNEYEYDYLSDEGIVNVLEQIDDTGTKTIEESFVAREIPLVISYTEEQQIVYNQIKKATSYKNITHIFSTDEISPIFEVTYKKDLETIVETTEGGTADSVDWSNVQNKPTKLSEFTNDSGYQTSTQVESAITAKGYQTANQVSTAISNAIANIQGISYSIVETLPTTGEAGVIYLISNSVTNPNSYEEYIWITDNFEKIGTTEVDLTGYIKESDLVAITNEEIDPIVDS